MIYPYYCFSTEGGSSIIEGKYAKDLGIYLFYDEEKDVFLDQNDNVVDIQGMEIFPRTGVYEAEDLVNAIEKNGGKSLVSNDDFEKTLNWPDYIPTRRNKIIMSGEDIMNNPDKIVELFGSGNVFFKTKEKNYSQVIAIEELLDKEGNFYKAINAHWGDDFIISDVVNIMEDEFGPLEYRGFVVDGKLLNVSRIHDCLMGRVPSGVIDKMLSVIEEAKKTEFPRTYVVDVFVCEDENKKAFVDVLECNPIIASGTYLYNSVFSATDDFEHKCPSKSIPVEKLKYGNSSAYSFDVKSKMIPSICYKLPGGFAADVLSFAMFGTSSIGKIIHIDMERDKSTIDIGSASVLDNNSDNNSSDEETFKRLRKQILDKMKND